MIGCCPTQRSSAKPELSPNCRFTRQSQCPLAAGILLSAVQLVAHSRKIVAHMRDKTFDLAEPLAAAIRKVLFEEWDPCSVNLNAECEEEYDDYMPAIHKLAKNGNSAAEIAAQLNFVENTMMGGIRDKALNLTVGGKIFALAEAAKRR